VPACFSKNTSSSECACSTRAVTCSKYLGSQPGWALKVRCLWPAQPHPCLVSGQSKLCLGLYLLFMASGCKVTLVCNHTPDANKCQHTLCFLLSDFTLVMALICNKK
jgi:hypothetical protein